MTIKDFFTTVAAVADNDTQKIGAAEVSRVLSVAFGILVKHDAVTVTGLIAKARENAAKKNAQAEK